MLAKGFGTNIQKEACNRGATLAQQYLGRTIQPNVGTLNPFATLYNAISKRDMRSKRLYSRSSWYDDERRASNRPRGGPPGILTQTLVRILRFGRNSGNGNTVIYGLIGAQAAVCGLWYVNKSNSNSRKAMWQNFVVSVRNLKEGRIWTPITTAISTDQPFSVLVNGFTLYFLGGTVMRMLGTGKFLGLYFGASVLASAAHVVYQSFFTPSYTQQQRWLSENAGMQGAAASTFSMAAFFATVYPTQSILLYGILPVPAAVLVGGLFGLNVYQSLQRGAPVMPELVGPLAGFALALALRGRVRF